MGSRAEVREALDKTLERPMDEEEAKEYDREHWGTGPEAEAAQQSSMWDDATY